MIAYIVRRFLEFIPTLLLILFGSFSLIYLAPGSSDNAERDVDPEIIAQQRKESGRDQPYLTQFANYLGDLAVGDFGDSQKYKARSVNELLADGFPATLTLAVFAILWALLLGISAGLVGAIRQNTVWDYGAMSVAMVGISIPSFVLGPLLALLFGLTLHWLPPGGWGGFRHIILPAITLGTIRAAYIARLTRGGMLEIVRSDFIRTARAKGLREQVIIWRHMLKGGLLPVVTFMGPAIANTMVGSVVVEKIFNTPGIGPYFVDAAINRDTKLMMGIVLVYAVLLLVMNLIVDILYGWLDPRIRYE